MNQTFNAFFNFNKGTVILNAQNLTRDFGPLRIFFGCGCPRILFKLFHAQRYPLFFLVVLDDFHGDLIADREPLRRMVDPSP